MTKRGFLQGIAGLCGLGGLLGLGIIGIIIIFIIMLLLSFVFFGIGAVVIIWALGVLNIATYPLDWQHVAAVAVILMVISSVIGGVKASFKN